MRLTLKTLTLSLTLALMATAASAARCAERAKVLQRLSESYGETVQGMGLVADSRIVEVFASLETGTWTITVTSPDGMTCLVASGQSYEAMASALPARGEDA